MSTSTAGGIDCDIHPAAPGLRALLPHLDEHWAETVVTRGMDGLDLLSYPPGSPLSCRPDWRPPAGRPGSDLDGLRRHLLDGFGARYAVCNVLHGAQALFSEDMAAGVCRAVNDWLAREWLDREPRLRASIVVPWQSPELAAEEVERCAPDRRFVQVLLLGGADLPLGRRAYWPLYRAAERHRLPIGVHAGSAYRHAPTAAAGWPSYQVEDYVAQAQMFQSQLLSLVSEGVFQKFPELRVVLIESGVTWLPAFLWRAGKTWRAARTEMPWVTRPPAEIIRDRVRMTIQPLDAPPDAADLERLLDQIGSDRMLLFSTDYPHWHFDGDAALPGELPADLATAILVDNPMETYPRLEEPPR